MNTIHALRIAALTLSVGALVGLAIATTSSGFKANIDGLKASGNNSTAYSTPTYVKPTAPRIQMGGTMGETTTTLTPSP